MRLLTTFISNYMRKTTKKNFFVLFIGTSATGTHYHEKCEATEEAEEGKQPVCATHVKL